MVHQTVRVAVAAAFSASLASFSASASAPPVSDWQPVTIEHALRATTIDSRPERIVTIGWSDQDAAIALGVVPVGTTEWFNNEPGALFPWAVEALADPEGARPEIVSQAGEINLEAVAALDPDLILALYEGLDEQEYELLSGIAPTVAHSADYDPFGTPWQDMTVTAGIALGREEQARQLVEDVESRFAEAAAAHPQWADETLLVMASVDASNYQVFSLQDPKVRFFAGLGFQTEFDWVAARVENNVATVSREEALEYLDADRLVWTSDPDTLATLDSDEIYSLVPAVQNDRVLYLDYTERPYPGAAVTFNSVLSIPYALELVIPELESADR